MTEPLNPSSSLHLDKKRRGSGPGPSESHHQHQPQWESGALGETSGGCLTQMAEEASGYTSLTLKASAAQSKNTQVCLLLLSLSALGSGLLPGTSDLKPAPQALAALKFPNRDVSRCLSFSFATSLVAAPFKGCPRNTKLWERYKWSPAFRTPPSSWLPAPNCCSDTSLCFHPRKCWWRAGHSPLDLGWENMAQGHPEGAGNHPLSCPY